MNQFNEPWKARVVNHGWEITDDNDDSVYDSGLGILLKPGDIRRIVACVNACAGVPNADLGTPVDMAIAILRDAGYAITDPCEDP